MDRQELSDAISDLESGESFQLLLSDDDTIEVGYIDCWVGGEGLDGYGCDMLGNINYQSPVGLANDIFNYVENELNLGIIDID